MKTNFATHGFYILLSIKKEKNIPCAQTLQCNKNQETLVVILHVEWTLCLYALLLFSLSEWAKFAQVF